MNSGTSAISWKRAILAQLVIIAALFSIYKLYVPGMEKRRRAAALTEGEVRIQAFAHTMIVEDATRDIPSGPDAGKHPQKVLRQDSLDEVQSVLGAPASESTDIRGGQHLTWTGTDHRLEAAFDKGVLYNLRYEDVRTGHGVTVGESGADWQTF